ncbi:MAG TPA: nucleotide exchange factor GrpE [Candidatus Angelobacter sp.]
MIDRSEILGRFEAWLDSAMAEEEPPQGIPAEILAGEKSSAESDPTDLYTMWAAVTALTQEVKLQGRAFKQLSESLAREAERRSRKEILDALLEIRERLLQGVESAGIRADVQPSLWDRIFRARWSKVRHALDVVEALEEGYRLSLARLDDLLRHFQVRPIECEGELFDPRLMSAVDVEETNELMDGTVVSVYRTGYEWNGEVYRPAQVRVARTPRGNAIHE